MTDGTTTTDEGLTIGFNFHRKISPALRDVEKGLCAVFSGDEGVISIVKQTDNSYQCKFERRFITRSCEVYGRVDQVKKWFDKWYLFTQEQDGPLIRDLKRKVRKLQAELRQLKKTGD
jgi:hypothetical protein